MNRKMLLAMGTAWEPDLSGDSGADIARQARLPRDLT